MRIYNTAYLQCGGFSVANLQCNNFRSEHLGKGLRELGLHPRDKVSHKNFKRIVSKEKHSFTSSHFHLIHLFYSLFTFMLPAEMKMTINLFTARLTYKLALKYVNVELFFMF